MQEMASSISSLVRIWNICRWCSSEGSPEAPVTSEISGNHRLLDLHTMATQRKYFKFLPESVPDVYVVFNECYKLNVYFALNTCIWYTWNLVICQFGLTSKERKTKENKMFHLLNLAPCFSRCLLWGSNQHHQENKKTETMLLDWTEVEVAPSSYLTNQHYSPPILSLVREKAS